MSGMGEHGKPARVRSTARGGPLHRAWISAWIVTITMGSTTMAFQVYHSVTRGHMPWPLAGLYGVVPLLIAMLVLEIVAEWHASSWVAKTVAYAVMVGSMFLSASATGAVVLYAAPPHFSLLFGALLDAAELLAAFFIMNGPRAADEAARKDAEALAATERAEADERLSLRRQVAELNARRDADVSALRAELDQERIAREGAQRELSEALQRVEALTRKAASVSVSRPRGSATASASRKAAGSTSGADGDVTTELRALMELQADPELCKPRKSPELAERLGISKSYARKLHGRLTREGSLNQEVAESLLDGGE